MNEPLANKLKPTKLEDVIGQSHLVSKDKILYNMVKNNLNQILNNSKRLELTSPKNKKLAYASFFSIFILFVISL